MRLLLLLLVQIYAQSYKPSENYKPIRHEETDRVITDKDVEKAVKKMRKLMGWTKKNTIAWGFWFCTIILSFR